MKTVANVGKFVRTYPAALTGLLIAGAVIAAAEGSMVPAIIQAICALGLACSIEWY